MAAVSLTRQRRHDRSVARRPPATVGTLRQHRFKLAQLMVRRIDHDCERMVAAMIGDPRAGLIRIVPKRFHIAR